MGSSVLASCLVEDFYSHFESLTLQERRANPTAMTAMVKVLQTTAVKDWQPYQVAFWLKTLPLRDEVKLLDVFAAKDGQFLSNLSENDDIYLLAYFDRMGVPLDEIPILTKGLFQLFNRRTRAADMDELREEIKTLKRKMEASV